MTDTPSCSFKISGSDDSLVLVEAADADDTIQVVESLSEISDSNKEEVTEQEQEGTTLYATDVHLVEESSSTKADSTTKGNTTSYENVGIECKLGAGIAVGIVTAPFLGPLAVIAGVAAAHGTTREGAAGDVCRAAGDVAIIAREKAMEVDRKHNLTNKTKESARHIIAKAKHANEKHKILDNFKKLVICSLTNIVSILQFAAEKVKESRKKSETNDSDDTSYEHGYEKVSLTTNEVELK